MSNRIVSLYLDVEVVTSAQKQGLNLSQICRIALERAITGKITPKELNQEDLKQFRLIWAKKQHEMPETGCRYWAKLLGVPISQLAELGEAKP